MVLRGADGRTLSRIVLLSRFRLFGSSLLGLAVFVGADPAPIGIGRPPALFPITPLTAIVALYRVLPLGRMTGADVERAGNGREQAAG